MRYVHCRRDDCFNVVREVDIGSLGSYCSLGCHNLHFRLPLETSADAQAHDVFLGFNAFRNQPTQMGATEEREFQQDSLNLRASMSEKARRTR